MGRLWVGTNEGGLTLYILRPERTDASHLGRVGSSGFEPAMLSWRWP
jgi:hypothetical protein